MKKTLILLLSILLMSANYGFTKENSEIDFLLSFVAESDCTFIRNGTSYDGPKASEHLQKKYNYAKSHIKNAEDFITRIASRSSLTKKPYSVRCGEQYFPTEKWFTDALMSYRATGVSQ